MAVAELAVNGRPVLTSNTPVKFLLPIQVANGLVSLLQQEMTSTVHFFYTDEKILIVVEAKSQGAGRYVIVVTRDEHGQYGSFQSGSPLYLMNYIQIGQSQKLPADHCYCLSIL